MNDVTPQLVILAQFGEQTVIVQRGGVADLFAAFGLVAKQAVHHLAATSFGKCCGESMSSGTNFLAHVLLRLARNTLDRMDSCAAIVGFQFGQHLQLVLLSLIVLVRRAILSSQVDQHEEFANLAVNGEPA